MPIHLTRDPAPNYIRYNTREYKVGDTIPDDAVCFNDRTELNAYLNSLYPASHPYLTRLRIRYDYTLISSNSIFPSCHSRHDGADRAAHFAKALEVVLATGTLTFADEYDAAHFCNLNPGYVQLTRKKSSIYFNPKLVAARKKREAATTQSLIDTGEFPRDPLLSLVSHIEKLLEIPCTSWDRRPTYPRGGGWGHNRISESDVRRASCFRINTIFSWYTAHAPRFLTNRIASSHPSLLGLTEPLLPYCHKHKSNDHLEPDTAKIILSIHSRCLAAARAAIVEPPSTPESSPLESQLQTC